MRIIKFRFYSNSLKVMYSPDNQIDNLWSIPEADNGILKVRDGDILMQFTGLKDKNGKDIYEGDIVKIECYAEWEDITYDGVFTGKAVMIASKGACIVNPIFKNNITGKIEKTNQYKNIAAYRSIIIGNIHENPELLT